MNQISYSPNDIQSFQSTVENLGQAFLGIENELKKTGNVVCQFIVNGHRLREEEEIKMSQIPIGQIQEIIVEYQSEKEVLASVLQGWVQSLPLLIQEIDRLSQTIKFQGIEGSLQAFSRVIENCQLLTNTLVSLREIDNNQSWVDAERSMGFAVLQALKAFEKKQFNELAEVLEYDLAHSIQMWLEIFQAWKTK